MNTAEALVQEIARQNQLLRETISRFPLLLDGSEEDGLAQDFDGTLDSSSPVSSSSSIASTASSSSFSETRINALLDLLNRQESRLDLLEQFGKSILADPSSPIPIFRGLTPTVRRQEGKTWKKHGEEEDIHVGDWCDLVFNHLRWMKSLNLQLSSKDLIKFIEAHLDLEPRKLIRTLLRRNRLLVRSNYPSEIPLSCQHDENILGESNEELLYEYPFKLYVLRFPRALLNMIQSKFNHGKDFQPQRSSSSPSSSNPLKVLRDRIHLQPGDSLLWKSIYQIT